MVEIVKKHIKTLETIRDTHPVISNSPNYLSTLTYIIASCHVLMGYIYIAKPVSEQDKRFFGGRAAVGREFMDLGCVEVVDIYIDIVRISEKLK